MKLVTSIIAGLAFIIGIWIAASAYTSRAKSLETVTVTGSAETDFVSDLIVWSGYYARKSMDLKNAYAMLKEDEKSIRTYLKEKGIADNQIVFSAIDINKEFSYERDQYGRSADRFTGYNLTQTVRIESNDVDKVLDISRQATDLIEKGIEFTSYAPAFYYTKLKDVKMDLLAKASADGQQRAEIIAKNAGSKLGKLKKANLGVFQITGKNTNEDYSYGGTFNTSSLNKTGSITIRMEFTLK
ncbi:MAG: SIMPL domain-containing protein [Chitinophagaceae bacterium]|nr:SIMPL domain-containing protein [Chitinophagaceae bacterium]